MSDSTPPERVTVRHVEIDATREGQRIDNFLLTLLKGVPKSRIYRCLRKGEVRVNKGRIGPEYRLQVGDIVRVPPIRVTPASKPKPDAEDFAWLDERVLFEDEHMFVVDKPSGLAVHAGSGIHTGLIEGMRALRAHTPMIELVHRLDRDTSGCLMLAKSRRSLTNLHEQLRGGNVRKDYLALVQGKLHHERMVTASIERHVRGGERMMEASDEGEGKESASRFFPKGQYGNATFVEIELLTGRTHQARVHAQHIGHPIAGDEKYGEKEFNRQVRALGLRRLFLHATRLKFRHPITNQKLTLEAPLPEELADIIEKLRGHPL